MEKNGAVQHLSLSRGPSKRSHLLTVPFFTRPYLIISEVVSFAVAPHVKQPAARVVRTRSECLERPAKRGGVEGGGTGRVGGGVNPIAVRPEGKGGEGGGGDWGG